VLRGPRPGGGAQARGVRRARRGGEQLRHRHLEQGPQRGAELLEERGDLRLVGREEAVQGGPDRPGQVGGGAGQPPVDRLHDGLLRGPDVRQIEDQTEGLHHLLDGLAQLDEPGAHGGGDVLQGVHHRAEDVGGAVADVLQGEPDLPGHRDHHLRHRGRALLDGRPQPLEEAEEAP
jgi:hypothetical protein